jgi:hypothetical protein
MAKLGRNDPCHCGSGKKYKKCCLEKDEAEAAQERAWDAAKAAAAYQSPPRGPVRSTEKEADDEDTDDFLDYLPEPPRHERRKALTLPNAPLERPPALADFAPGTDREPLDDAIEQFTLDWVGTVHQQHGVALDKLGMAREVLEAYLRARADDAASGHALLIPSAAALDETLWGEVESEPSGVAAFLGLLPTYVGYLVEREIVDPDAEARILAGLGQVRQVVLQHLREEFAFATLMSMVEPVQWPEPPPRVLAPVPPDLVPLLEELGQAGEHPDRDPLDRIVDYGPGAIPPLIDLATDDQLLFPGGEDPEIWTPVHAVQLLGEMRAQEAIEPLLPLLEFPGDQYICVRAQEALGLIGATVLPHVRKLLADKEQDQYLRARCSETVKKVAQHYPETRSGAVQALQAELDAGANPELNAFIIGDLADLQATEAMPSIERAYGEDRVDDSIIGDLEEVRKEMEDPGATGREFLAAMKTEEP